MRRKIPGVAVAMSVGLLGSAALAGWEGLCLRDTLALRDRAARPLREAAALAVRHPAIFSRPRENALGKGLKTIVQESASIRGVSIGFLSESEKEVRKGQREREVSARLVRAEHGKLALFLGDLEEKGQGAILKEIHLRPSKDASGVYEEVEIVLAKVTSSGGNPP